MKCGVNIACALRWGVVLVEGILYWAWLTLMGQHFRCRVYTGERRLVDDVFVKKVDMWP